MLSYFTLANFYHSLHFQDSKVLQSDWTLFPSTMPLNDGGKYIKENHEQTKRVSLSLFIFCYDEKLFLLEILIDFLFDLTADHLE